MQTLLAQQFLLIIQNLAALGTRRLLGLGGVGLLLVSSILTGAYYLNRPEFEMLYAGLSPVEASRMGAVLRDNGINFDLSADGASLLVQRGRAAAARMLLAEKGLPGNTGAGYELFDKMGSLGLTSFMQEVTRVRALEGELARSIQTLKGIRAARVHIVMAEASSLRKSRPAPSASVVVRTDHAGDLSSTEAIRHLVSAAVQGMTLDQVRVLSTDGTVLAGGTDGEQASQGRQSAFEKSVSKELQENVRQTLAPYLGIGNFQISVAARLNTDKRQSNETSYDPNTRVERSVRTIREAGNTTAAAPGKVSVEQNIPGDQKGDKNGDLTKKSNDRRDELTNFELSSKSTSTTSEGYRIEALTVAVVVNRKQLLAVLGGNPTKETIDARISEIERIVSTAAGVEEKRGDRVTVAAVDFLPGSETLEPSPTPGLFEVIAQQSGAYMKAFATIIAAFVITILGLRPIARTLLVPASLTPNALAIEGNRLESVARATNPEFGMSSNQELTLASAFPALAGQRPIDPAQSALDEFVMGQEEQAAAVLKQWLKGARV